MRVAVHVPQATLEQLQRGRIDPMRVFDHQSKGRCPARCEHLLDQQVQRALVAALRRHIQRAVAIAAVQPEQRRAQRHRLRVASRERLELVQRRSVESCASRPALRSRRWITGHSALPVW